MSKKFQPLNNYLQNSVEFATIRAKLQQNQGLLGQIKGALPSPLSEHCVGLAIKHTQLTLYADSSVWASKLRYFTREISSNLNKKKIYFNKINVKISIDNRSKTPIKSRRRSRLLSASNSDQMQKIADHIPDTDLRAALLRLSTHKQRK